MSVRGREDVKGHVSDAGAIRAGVARGEASCDLFSDEACGPPLAHQGAGLAVLTTGTGALVAARPSTSNCRTARCGPAYRVVREGRSQMVPPYPDLALQEFNFGCRHRVFGAQ